MGTTDEELPENEDLDSEGVPPLEGALHEKELTGDEQEGVWPPRDYSVAQRILHTDDLDRRLKTERPDRLSADDEPALLVDEETGDDIDADLADDEIYPSSEEAAVHITENPPGAVDHDIDSYTGEPLTKKPKETPGQ